MIDIYPISRVLKNNIRKQMRNICYIYPCLSRKRKRSDNEAIELTSPKYQEIFNDVMSLLKGEIKAVPSRSHAMSTCADYFQERPPEEKVKVPRVVWMSQCDDPCESLWRSLEMIIRHKFTMLALSPEHCDGDRIRKIDDLHFEIILPLRFGMGDESLRKRVCLSALICRINDSFGISFSSECDTLKPKIKVRVRF